MPASVHVEVYKMGKRTEKELSEMAKIRFRLPSLNAYMLEPLIQDMQNIPERDITKFYENFISELRKKKCVKRVSTLDYSSLHSFDG